ncbi:MAG: hypothetical protein ACAH80_01590 [Alphaproteobacteria bacterium]
MNGFDPAGLLVDAVDGAFMGLYQQARSNASRITRLGLTLVPLMMLLVGSCKTESASVYDGAQAGVDYFRAALFPDRVLARDASYEPAAGYVSRAQDFVAGDPATLMRLTEQEVAYLYGKPTMERRDADAKIWQYRTKACVVDFYFYEQKGREHESSVAFVDYRLKGDLVPGTPANDNPVNSRHQQRCLKKIAI